MSKKKETSETATASSAVASTPSSSVAAELEAARLAGSPGPRKLVWPQPANPGMRFEIRTPNLTFTGERAGLKFIEGIAYTDSDVAAADCRGFGYVVTDTLDDASKKD